jgi:hypothetical protein
VVRQQRRVRGSTRQFDFATRSIDQKSVVAVLHEDAADIADVVGHTGNDHMRVVGRWHVRMQCPAAQNIVTGERDQHRVLDIVIERVAVADAFQRDARDRRHQLDQAALGLAVSPIHVVGEKVAQRVSRQLRNGHHEGHSRSAQVATPDGQLVTHRSRSDDNLARVDPHAIITTDAGWSPKSTILRRGSLEGRWRWRGRVTSATWLDAKVLLEGLRGAFECTTVKPKRSGRPV